MCRVRAPGGGEGGLNARRGGEWAQTRAQRFFSAKRARRAAFQELGFSLPVTHSPLLRYFRPHPELCRACLPIRGTTIVLCPLHVGLSCKILFGIKKTSPMAATTAT